MEADTTTIDLEALRAKKLPRANHGPDTMFPEYWSVDVLKAEDDCYVTDMALGDRSWHWPGCPLSPNVGGDKK